MQRYCLVVFVTCLFLCVAGEARATEWRECEKAKLRQLDLQQSQKTASPSRKHNSSKSRSANVRGNVEQLDEWLWKNCREYSYELRTLEQQKM